jgi:alkylation response protein AidB-like acyl-CoA dehydrogenase
MDLKLGKEHETFRDEVIEFLKGWPLTGKEAELPQLEQDQFFRNKAIEKGYVYRDIPTKYGGSEQPHDVIKDTIIQDEFRKVGAPGNIFSIGAAMVAPTLLECAREELCDRFVQSAIRGEVNWCQGYSEPNAGSDLASLQTRAELDGDEWVINGQKAWTSMAAEADYMFGLFRTEPDAPKHKGISYLLIDMKSPGITIRPVKQINGGFEFNEVFFDNVRTPVGMMVSQRGNGWQISRATLKHERNLIGDPNMLRNTYCALVELARNTIRNGRPAIEDPHVRDRLAEIDGFVTTQEYSGLRQLSAAAKGEELKVMLPMMMNKLYSTDAAMMLTRLSQDLIAGDGLIAPNDVETAMARAVKHTPGRWVYEYTAAIAHSIAGGASNIQRNIIGERALGLPRDLRLE